MPTYQYACTECGDQLEVVQRFSDDPLTVCGACGGRLRKVFSPVGIVFKGSGFYRTDSRSASVNGKAKAVESSAGSEGSSGGTGESGAKSASESGPNGSSSDRKEKSAASGSGSSGSGSSGSGSKVA